jgi:hypothetical protein
VKPGYTCQGRRQSQRSIRPTRAWSTHMHFPCSRYISESRNASDNVGNILYTCSRRCGSSLASRSGNGGSESERRGGRCEDWGRLTSNSCFIGALEKKARSEVQHLGIAIKRKDSTHSNQELHTSVNVMYDCQVVNTGRRTSDRAVLPMNIAAPSCPIVRVPGGRGQQGETKIKTRGVEKYQMHL